MMNTSLDQIKQAFNQDGFDVYDFSKDSNYGNMHKKNEHVTILQGGGIQFNGRTGVMAVHRNKCVQIGDTVRRKKAFYVEGDHYEMGFLIGVMAEPDVYQMGNNYLNKIIPSFIHFNADNDTKNIIIHLLELFTAFSRAKHDDLPEIYSQEIKGLFDGCRLYKSSIGGGTKKILYERLITLNIGIDVILSQVYTGVEFAKRNIEPDQLKVPIMCNAFSIKGKAVKDNNHYFGRDFMFATADIFQDVACMTIYNPDYPDAVPTVSQTAPGFVGSVTAMNLKGLAAGTDMNPSRMTSASRPGFNSLGLVRDSIQYSSTIDDFINRIKNAQRGVTWFYPGADGQSGRACFVEAGKNIEDTEFPYFDFMPDSYKLALQSQGLTEQFVADMQKKYGNKPQEKGIVVRESTYNYPVEYLQFNKILVDTYNQQTGKNVPYINAEKNGYINKTTYEKASPNYPGTDDQNCPAALYFAPQRENCDDLLIVTNSNISPEMRLTAMNDWITRLTGSDMNDIQWRYDELNNQLLTAIDEAGKESNKLIDLKKAKQLIDFRAPGSNEGYDVKFKKDNWETIQIHGSVSVCELKSREITSHYGYYGDPWVTINLPNYFIQD